MTTKLTIDSDEVKGEPGTGYEGPEGGPFRCSNCSYFNATTDGCHQKTMKKVSTRPRLPSGDVEVDPHGCCEYIERRK